MQRRVSEGEKPENVSIDDYDIPPAPIRYVVKRWRKEMHAGYADAMQTPFEVILQDMEMEEYEADYGPQRA